MFFQKRNEKVPVTFIILFSVMVFSWYIYVSNATSFYRFLRVGDNIYRSLSEFFDPWSRGKSVLTAFGLTESPSFWHTVSRGLFYVTEGLIGIGFISLIVKRKKNNFNAEYALIISANLIILMLCVALPSFAGSLGMERFFSVLLLVLAPLCVIGGKTVLERLLTPSEKHWSLILVLFILIPFFLFQTGFAYEITEDEFPSSVSLSMQRMGETPYISFGLLREGGVFGANWLSEHADTEHTPIYCDIVSQRFVLTSYTSYGTMYENNVILLTKTTNPMLPEFYVYLGKHNLVNGVIFAWQWLGGSFNSTDLSSLFENSNKIYSNEACEIYEK